MANPLDEQLQFFRSAMDAFKITRRVLDRRSNPVSNTGLYGRTQDEGHAILDQAEEQLNKLVAFALFAAFERTLRDHLTSSLSPISGSSTIPEELADKLAEFLRKNVDYWKIDDVIELFHPPAGESEVSNAKGIRTFRHHVAHGETPPNAIPPQTVYKQLTEFLMSTGLAR